MRILYDHQIFENQIYGGISRYYYEVIKGMDHHPDVSYSLPLVESSNYYIKQVPELAKHILRGSDYYNQFMWGIDFPGKWMLYQRWSKLFPHVIHNNQQRTIETLQNGEFDLFHPTDVHDYFLPYIGNKPYVLTIHDMIDEYFPEYSFHVHSTYRTSVKEKLIKGASGVIAVSEATKHDLLERFQVDEKKIKVIHHGVSSIIGENRDDMKPNIPGKYFLFVGKRVHYKNFYFFLQCIQSILASDKFLKIVCVGAPFNNLELRYFSDLKIAENIIHCEADDFTLTTLYRNACAFVYPSLYEGFGMPILEAFKNLCPVILSETRCFKEVAGEAGMYFNPKDIDSVRHAFLSVLNNDPLREEMIKKGTEQLKMFSWEKSVKSTLDFYKSII